MILGERYIKNDSIIAVNYDAAMKRAEITTPENILYCHCTKDDYIKAIFRLDSEMKEGAKDE